MLEKYYTIPRSNDVVRKVTGAGSVFSLKIILDMHNMEIVQSEGTQFMVSFNKENDFFDAANQAFEVKPGENVLYDKVVTCPCEKIIKVVT